MRSLLVCVVLVLSGCVVESVPDTTRDVTLVLRYTLIGQAEDNGYASPGPHCGTAVLRDDRVQVEAEKMQDIGASRPFLIVVPRLEGRWATLGTSPYARTLGAVVSDINHEDVTIATIEWIGNATHGHVEVDGDPVTLPHRWEKTNHGDDWRVEANLTRGPSRVETFRAGPCA